VSCAGLLLCAGRDIVVGMEAHVYRHRIHILGSSSVARDTWEPLLDDLKAEHVTGLTPHRKRIAVAVNPKGRIDAFIYRTKPMPDDEIVRILGKYGIPATVKTEPEA
jgi:hypothetical protein